MIDIHCHILPGLDDGPKLLEESVAMGKIAYADGIRHIVATPHFTETLLNDRGTVAARTKEVQQALHEAGLDITLYPGNEVRLVNADFFRMHRESRTFGYLNDKDTFLLLEQRWNSYDPDSEDIVRELVADGITPIVAHPERHAFFREQPKLLGSLLAAGAWTQVSVDSLNGTNNKDAQSFANWLIDRDWVHTIATDAHSVKRKPNLSQGFDLIRDRGSRRQADRILERMKQVIGLS